MGTVWCGCPQDRAAQERALQERREQQLAALRERELAAEEEKRQVASELRVMKVQVAENNRLRERVDELLAALALSSAPRPGADAYCQAGSGSCGGLGPAHSQPGFVVLEEPLMPMPSAAPALLPPAPTHHAGAVMAATSLASWPGHVPGLSTASLTLGRAASGYGPSDNLLRSYNAIPEADPSAEELMEAEEEARGGARGRRRSGFRPLRFMFGLVLKGTLVAGGMAAGIALGNPKV